MKLHKIPINVCPFAGIYVDNNGFNIVRLTQLVDNKRTRNETIIKNLQDVLSLTYDLKDKKKEYLVCLYLNARNVLIKKETISIGLLDKSLVHPREIF